MHSIQQKGSALLCYPSCGCTLAPPEYLKQRLSKPIACLFKLYHPLREAVCLLKELAMCKDTEVNYITVSLTEQAMCSNPAVHIVNMELRQEMPTTIRTDSQTGLGIILQYDGSSFCVQDTGLGLGILKTTKGK